MAQTLAISLLLIRAGLGQHGSEPLVGHDGAGWTPGCLSKKTRQVRNCPAWLCMEGLAEPGCVRFVDGVEVGREPRRRTAA